MQINLLDGAITLQKKKMCQPNTVAAGMDTYGGTFIAIDENLMLRLYGLFD